MTLPIVLRHVEDIDPRQPVNVFTAESHQTTFMTPNCQLACQLRDYIHKDVRGEGSNLTKPLTVN